MNFSNPIVRFFLARILVLQQGVPEQEASRLAVVALFLRGPLGLVAPTIMARNEASAFATPPPPQTGGVVAIPKGGALMPPAHEHKGKGSHHSD
jgi:hypothetical protein